MAPKAAAKRKAAPAAQSGGANANKNPKHTAKGTAAAKRLSSNQADDDAAAATGPGDSDDQRPKVCVGDGPRTSTCIRGGGLK